MEPPRSTKSRSLGVNPRTQRAVASAKLKRPDLGERHKSAPSAVRRHHLQSQQVSDGPKSLDASARSSQASSRRGSVSYVSQRSESRRPSQNSDVEPVSLLKLVVLGNPDVGKTSFIRHALDLRKPATTPIFSSRVSLHGNVYRVQMTELDLDDVEIQDGRHISWPKYVGDLPFSSPDAVICLYDITDSESILGVPQFLSALANLDTPVELVASKTDLPQSDHELDSAFTEKVRSKFPHVLIAESSTKSSENAKRCMLMVMKAILDPLSSTASDATASKPPAVTQADLFAKVQDSTILEDSIRGQISGFSSTEQLQAINEPDTYSSDEMSIPSSDEEATVTERTKTLMRLQTFDLNRASSTVPQGPQTPVSDTDPYSNQSLSARASAVVPQTPESYHNSTTGRPGTSGTADSQAHQTFYNVDDESPAEDSPSDELSMDNLQIQNSTRAYEGVSFADLVDKLLQFPKTKPEMKFTPAFLCLYRSFSTPKQLIIAIVDRFVKTEASDMQHMAKVTELLRYLQVMAHWTASYPGDFACASVRELAIAFVDDIEKAKSFSHAAKEINNNLQMFVHDADADWAYVSTSKLDHDTTKSNSLYAVETGIDIDESNSDDSDDDSESYEPSGYLSARHSGTASTVSSMLRSKVPSSQSATNLAALETAREQARRMRSIPHLDLNKAHWHLFMETPNEELARELTRIDWTMYSAIRPRDFVRHVMVSSHGSKDDNISAMIKHFNHLALFVAGVVLLRDKPKHRAKALAKFMDLAWKVRHFNNYNSLAALVAGVTSHEVVRLAQTHELVPIDVKKQFLRLTVLMASAKSYATYRMAWENSAKERIPFISTVLRDLTLGACANQTFVGDRINWKKFEIMGETIIHIQRSYEHPYSFPERTQRIQDVMKLFLETKVTEEREDSADQHNELYNRSLHVEPQPGAGDNRKKFDWLRR